MPRFSVLLPTHNRADVIGYSIRSVLMQTEADFELLIAGDGCTDATASVVAAFDDSRIRWFDLPKAQWSGAANRNTVLREAKGDIVVYAQHDDLMFPDHLARVGDAMMPGRDWGYTRPVWVTTDGIVVPFATNLTIADELTHFMQVDNTIPSNCVFHRRDCLDRFGFFDDLPGSVDWRLWHRMIRGRGAAGIAYQPVPATLHFSAVSRQSRFAGMRQIEAVVAAIDAGEWWPDALRFQIAGPQQEQRIVFEAMEQGGQRFVNAMRDAIIEVMDRQAWLAVQRVAPRLRICEADIDALRAEHAVALARVSDLTAALADRDTRLADASAELAVRADTIAALDVRLHDATGSLQEQRNRLDAILASRSWRLLAPLRRLFHAVRGNNTRKSSY